MKSNIGVERQKVRNDPSKIVVKFQDCQDLPCWEEAATNDFFLRNPIIPWPTLLRLFPGLRIEKLFASIEPEKIMGWIKKAKKSDPGYQPTDFHGYFAIDCPFGIQLDALLDTLLACKTVELAYIENGAHFPPYSSGWKNVVSNSQRYLNPAPDGINATYAWDFAGGDGKGKVRFIDLEKGWIVNHEAIQVGTLPDTGINNVFFADHGAAVLGIILMQQNATGGMGITPMAEGYVMSQWRPDGSHNTADAIMAAIAHLRFGDILLLEGQELDSAGDKNLLPLEIHDATCSAIRLATALGIIVIEAGGNGNPELSLGNDLDQFESDGKRMLNPKSLDFRDSGAILVGAASHDAPHTRLQYSNYGSRVNCYACGEGVLTAGNYPRASGYASNCYTQQFGGTSCATAIIAGAAIAVQSLVEANHNYRFSPVQMRQILGDDAYGSPSINGRAIDKIGVMPDLKKIIDYTLDLSMGGMKKAST